MDVLAARVRPLALGLALAGAVACASSRPPSPQQQRTAPVTTRAEAPRDAIHVVKKGETIYRLSRNYRVSVDAIVRANAIKDVGSVPIGAKLRIPGAARRRANDTRLASIAPAALYPASRIGESDLRFRWPVQGKLSSRYGWRGGKRHEGIDIATRPGTHAVHRLGHYRDTYGLRAEDFSVAAAAEDTSITLPIFPGMTDHDQDRVRTSLRAALQQPVPIA